MYTIHNDDTRLTLSCRQNGLGGGGAFVRRERYYYYYYNDSYTMIGTAELHCTGKTISGKLQGGRRAFRELHYNITLLYMPTHTSPRMDIIILYNK